MKRTFWVLLALLLLFSGCNSDKEEKNTPETLILDFFEAKQQNFLSEEDISLSGFFTQSVQENFDSQTFAKLFRWEKLARRDVRESLISESFDMAITEIQISGTEATATVKEHYLYYMKELDGEESGRATTYTISCQKIQDAWKISHIETDNEVQELVEGMSMEEVNSNFQ